MKACKYCDIENQDDAAQCYVCHSIEFVVPVPVAKAVQADATLSPKSPEPMQAWFRWMILILTVGGGFTGLAVTVQGIFQMKSGQLANLLIYIPFLVLFGFTIVSGLLFADNPKDTIPLKITLIAQIPAFSSPVFAYGFSAGFRASAGIISGHFVANFYFGSDCQLFFFAGRPWGISINFFMLGVFLLLLKNTRRLA
jgi:hypothetical protein